MFDDRIMLITGKGGVGRSVTAAALSYYWAEEGADTLLCDMGASDGGHSPLARLFGLDKFGARPELITDHLYACHLTAEEGHRNFLTSTIPGGALLSSALNSVALQTFMQSAPSFAEMGIFYQLLGYIKAQDHHKKIRYKHIIVDLPATGHTLALTGLPSILLKIIRRGPVANGLREGQKYLNNADFCHAWIVTLPEQLPVSESFELIAGLEATNVPVGGLILNKRPDCDLSPAEIQKAAKAMAGKNILGSYELERRRRADEAEERLLSDDCPVDFITVPEFSERGFALVQEVAAVLGEVVG